MENVMMAKGGWFGRVLNTVAGWVALVLFIAVALPLGTLYGFARRVRRHVVDMFASSGFRIGDMKRMLATSGVIVSALFAYVYLFAVEVSALAAGPLLAWCGVVMFYVVVKYGHREINLIQELKNRNDAVVYHFRSYGILIALLLAAPVLALAL